VARHGRHRAQDAGIANTVSLETLRETLSHSGVLGLPGQP